MEIEGGEIEKNIVIIVRNVGFVMHLFIITYPTQLCFFLLQEFPLDIDCDPAIEVPESSDSADDICWHLIKEKKYIFNPQKKHFLCGYLSSPHTLVEISKVGL